MISSKHRRTRKAAREVDCETGFNCETGPPGRPIFQPVPQVHQSMVSVREDMAHVFVSDDVYLIGIRASNFHGEAVGVIEGVILGAVGLIEFPGTTSYLSVPSDLICNPAFFRYC